HTSSPGPEIVLAGSSRGLSSRRFGRLRLRGSHRQTQCRGSLHKTSPIQSLVPLLIHVPSRFGIITHMRSPTPHILLLTCLSIWTASAQALARVVPPARIVSFTAQPATVQAGQPVTLVWATENPNAVTIDQGVGRVTARGSKQVTPSATTKYTLNVTGPNN